MIESLLMGIETVFQPLNLLILFSAVFIGFLGGALPGISGTMLVVILLPITYGFDTTSAFLLLTAIYAATVFSGMISAILFRTPGTPEAVATVFDGYPMAKSGHSSRALGIAIVSSGIGGIFGTLVLIFLTPVLASVALTFSSPEFFGLALLGLTVVASLSAGQLSKGIIGVAFGLFIATIGIDPLSGTQRYTFDMNGLSAGVELIPVLIGLFAVAEVLKKGRENTKEKQEASNTKIKIFEKEIFKKIYRTITRSSLMGTFIGILPGVGATTASMLSYSEAVRWSKNPKKFGKGAPEGIAAPESANNSAAMGALVPLLALGIPGSATTAVLIGAFILHGLQPGPNLLETQSNLVYAIFIGLLIVNTLIIVCSKPFIKLFTKIMNIPYYILGPIILMFCIIGTFAVRNSVFDVWVMLIFGALGYLFTRINFPVAPIVLGVVLGPIAEDEFRRSLQLSGGNWFVFFERPVSAGLIIVAVLFLVYPLIKKLFKKSKSSLQSEAG
ncbi:putative tricarboxylic transport membrane protein [Geomicrobium halophilum]|uniref:Putative tricarboxylic transport membrane protein n=1 Tax=Geomicrobium halophilum TaxID=549000 RepID=A0A841PXF5_9BACL|nr:tripartite tricarboxylate transporter permease [Geomicrobium halophilum]MBB6448665.1 putative tricarboxylic transport membrane protein [Geomicrobium halophilum]